MRQCTPVAPDGRALRRALRRLPTHSAAVTNVTRRTLGRGGRASSAGRRRRRRPIRCARTGTPDGARVREDGARWVPPPDVDVVSALSTFIDPSPHKNQANSTVRPVSSFYVGAHSRPGCYGSWWETTSILADGPGLSPTVCPTALPRLGRAGAQAHAGGRPLGSSGRRREPIAAGENARPLKGLRPSCDADDKGEGRTLMEQRSRSSVGGEKIEV